MTDHEREREALEAMVDQAWLRAGLTVSRLKGSM
jgi:hypothetical protein